MAIVQVRCPVSGADVPRLVDLEDRTIRIICAEYDEATRICRLKKRAHEGGPLSQLLERVTESTLATKNLRCELS